MRVARLLLAVFWTLLLAPAAIASSEQKWIYDIFVKECRDRGGTPASSFEDFMADLPFDCATAASGASGGGDTSFCETQAREAVDWVFRDDGARGTFQSRIDAGHTPFESVVAAQGHNRNAQNDLNACRAWVEAYLGGSGPERLSREDCACVSVIPTGEIDRNGRPEYRISNNSCDVLIVSVRFIGDILQLTATPAFSSWGGTPPLSRGESATVWAPAWKFVSIDAIRIRRGSSSFACPF